ncbi:MAG: preprotein translocase subunit TatA [Frankiales bacterium]|jgi:sec-independent protein translocase protein TatA|nr:preprotein translocase subunit TatA [Frankiales bacterium]
MPNLGPTELIIIAVVIMVLFGAKRLPDAARSLGRSARILKAETKGLHEDDAPKAVSGAGSVPVARFDPMTGEPLARFDPVTGQPVAGQPLEGQPGTTDRP